MNESIPLTDRIGVAFGTYCSPEGLIATIKDLLMSDFSHQDLCVVGSAGSLSQSLSLLQQESEVDAGQISLFARTESFFGNDYPELGVGSKGRFLATLKSLMERRRNCKDKSRDNEYSLESADLKKLISKGYQTLFVCTSTPEQLVPALRILIKRSTFNVQSHEFRR